MAGLSPSVDERRGSSLARGGERTEAAFDDDDTGFETASASTLSSFLSQPPLLRSPPPLRGDEEAARRLRVAEQVHASWTQRGTEPAGLAERFLDGSIDALDELVLGDAGATEEDGDEEEEREGARDDGAVPRRRRCLGPPIAVVDACSLSYDDFVSRFMEPGVPVIVRGAARSWKSYREWGRRSGKGRRRKRLPLPLALAAAASPDAEAPVVDCETGLRTEENVREFARRWSTLERGGGGGDERRLYLKDWHFCRPARSTSSSSSSTSAPLEGGGESWYVVPTWFSDDWLNGAVLAGVSLRGAGGEGNDDVVDVEVKNFDDYRFVYAGPSSTSTPLHADVLSTCSWSANVAGRKRWRLLPPEKTHLLYDRFGRTLAPDFFPTPCSPDSSFPLLRLAPGHVSEAVQEAGDAIFVPPGWHHTVENLGADDDEGEGEEEAEEGDDGDGDDGDDEKSDDGDGSDDSVCGGAISINHNWFNAHSLRWVLELLRSERRSAAEAIDDCRSTTTPLEFETLVQRNLGASAGMDFAGLSRVLEWACERAERRCEALYARAAKGRERDGGEERRKDDDSSSLLLARVLSCRLDATRARSAAEALAGDLSLTFSSPSGDGDDDGSRPTSTRPPSTAPSFVADAIERALVASRRALRAAERAEREIGKSRGLGREH